MGDGGGARLPAGQPLAPYRTYPPRAGKQSAMSS